VHHHKTGREKIMGLFNNSKKECASCGNKLSFGDSYILKDESKICGECLTKAGFNYGSTDIAFLKNNVTLDTLFDNQSQNGIVHQKNIQTTDSNAIKCPKCNSANVQFMQQDKKAFSVGKAVGGTVLTGGVGALAGFAGKKGKKQWFCQNCNSIFETK